MGSALSNLMTPRQQLLARKARLQKSLYLTTWECLIAKPIVTIESMDEPKFVHAKVETKVEEVAPVQEQKPKRKPATKKPPTRKASKSTK